jgi:hypothetical protein
MRSTRTGRRTAAKVHPPPPSFEALLTLDDLAAVLRVTARTLRTWKRAGVALPRPLPRTSAQRKMLFTAGAVRQWLAEQERAGKGVCRG